MFRFTWVINRIYLSPNALVHYKLRASEYAEIQSCIFFDFGVQQMLKILIAKWTKAYGEKYVLSITQVKQNLLTVVYDHFNKVYVISNKSRTRLSDFINFKWKNQKVCDFWDSVMFFRVQGFFFLI